MWKEWISKQFIGASSMILAAVFFVFACAALVWVVKFLIYIWER